MAFIAILWPYCGHLWPNGARWQKCAICMLMYYPAWLFWAIFMVCSPLMTFEDWDGIDCHFMAILCPHLDLFFGVFPNEVMRWVTAGIMCEYYTHAVCALCLCRDSTNRTSICCLSNIVCNIIFWDSCWRLCKFIFQDPTLNSRKTFSKDFGNIFKNLFIRNNIWCGSKWRVVVECSCTLEGSLVH